VFRSILPCVDIQGATQGYIFTENTDASNTLNTLWHISLKHHHLEKQFNLTIGCNVKGCLAITILEIYVSSIREQQLHQGSISALLRGVAQGLSLRT